MDDLAATLERRASRGVARGADTVLRNAARLNDGDGALPVDIGTPKRPRRRLLVATAVVVVLLIGAATWAVTRKDDASDRVVTTPTTGGTAPDPNGFSMRVVTGTQPPPCQPDAVPGVGPLACFELGSVVVTGDDVANAYVGRGVENGWDVLVDLTPAGLQAFNAAAAQAPEGTKIAIVVDGRVRAAPVLSGSELRGSLEISDPSFTEQSARDLAAAIKASGNPVPTVGVTCDAILTAADLERLGVQKAAGPEDPHGCSYDAEPANAGDPPSTLGITLRTRSEPTDDLPTTNDAFIVQKVTGLGAPAAWMTTNAGAVPPTVPGQAVTTSSTAIGTKNTTPGQLIVKPRGYLLTIHVNGMYNNVEEAKLAAQLILAHL